MGVLGRDGVGWSIDREAEGTIAALRRSNQLQHVRSARSADVVMCLWPQLKYANRLSNWHRRGKKIVASLTTEALYAQDFFEQVGQHVDVWACANLSQVSFVEARGGRAFHHPFIVSEEDFFPIRASRKSLALALGVEPKRVAGKILIVNYQRDSLGRELSQPKWQKNPLMLREIAERLTKEQYLFLLAGPRRHWIVRELELRGVDFLYVGGGRQKSRKDDILKNALSPQTLNTLLNLADVSLITSSSEGGPKQLAESLLAGTPVVSTPVGWAPDFLTPDYLFSDVARGVELLRRVGRNPVGTSIDGFRRELFSESGVTARIEDLVHYALSV